MRDADAADPKLAGVVSGEIESRDLERDLIAIPRTTTPEYRPGELASLLALSRRIRR